MQLDQTIQTEHAKLRRNTYLHERWLDALPGIILLTTALISIIGAIFFPLMTMRAAAVFALYSIIRFLRAGIAHSRGVQKIKSAEQQYGHNQCQDDITHVIIVPNYDEPEHILCRSLERLAQWSHAQDSMIVVLAMEQHEPNARRKAQSLIKTFAGRFKILTFSLHPDDLPGEIRCKSANLSWAAYHLETQILPGLNIDTNKVVVTTMDADTLWHPHYFDALSTNFAQSKSPHSHIWQAPIRYHANIYDIHPSLRLANVYSTAMELAYLAAEWWPSLPISSYSLSLNLLRRMNYWETNVIADEWHTYINGYFNTRGQLNLEPIYLPFQVNAVTGENFWIAMLNRYKQTLRHSWGSKEIGYTLHQIRENPKVPAWRIFLSVGHDLIQGSAGAALLTFGSQLPLIIHPDLRNHILSNVWQHPAFIILQLALVVTMILGAMFLYVDIQSRPLRTKPVTRMERVQAAIGFMLLPVYGVVFVILPLVHAQLLLLLGRKLSFEVTAKE